MMIIEIKVHEIIENGETMFYASYYDGWETFGAFGASSAQAVSEVRRKVIVNRKNEMAYQRPTIVPVRV